MTNPIPSQPGENNKPETALGDDLSVGELRAVIMKDENGANEQVTLAARVPDGVLSHDSAETRVGFFPGLIVVEEETLSVPVLVLFVIVNDQYDPPCDLAVNITDQNAVAVLERFVAQEQLHLVVADSVAAKSMALGGNPVSRQMLPKLIAHARKMAPPVMPEESFWNVARAIYGAFNGASGLLALFSNLLNEGQDLPIFTFKPSDVADSQDTHEGANEADHTP